MAAYILETDLTEMITLAAEVAAGAGSVLAGFKNVELARKYYDLYKQQRDFYYNVFQLGVEVPLLQDVYNKAYYYRDYAARVNTLYNSQTGPFGGESGDISGWWERHANMYGQAKDTQINELETDTARLRSDWSNYLFRFEELWADVRNDQRWANRLMVHNIGLKQGTNVTSNLNSSLKEYQEQIGDLGNMLATYGNGIAKYAGYKRGMADTADDFSRGTAFGAATTGINRTGGMHTDYVDRQYYNRGEQVA